MPLKPCPKCGSPMTHRNGRFGGFIGCSAYPECDIILNAFGYSDQETRDARKAAHAAFDALWHGNPRKRGYCYKMLAEHMKLMQKDCHIQGFSVEQCRLVIEWAKKEGGR